MTAIQVTEAEAAKLIKARSPKREPGSYDTTNTVHNMLADARAVLNDADVKSDPAEPDPTPTPDSVVPGRILADIEKDIAALSKVQRKNVYQMGALLIEANERVVHGDWLPWLHEHFERSVSTAENYMSAARYLAKFPTVGNLKLRDSAVYWLAGKSSLAESNHAGTNEDRIVARLGSGVWSCLASARLSTVGISVASDPNRQMNTAMCESTGIDNSAQDHIRPARPQL